MRVTCECGNDTFHILFQPPLKGVAQCTECGEKRGIGGKIPTDD